MTDSAEKQPKWYTLSTEDVAKQLQVDPAKGLSSDEAKSRLQKYGPNRLAEEEKVRMASISRAVSRSDAICLDHRSGC
jgi:magnesium-transporting ATPase (P-type)